MTPFYKRFFTLSTVTVLAGAFFFLYLNLFYIPFIPIHPHVGESVHLFNATRMVDGQSIYRDVFQATLPATEVLYFILFKILGVHAWIPNAMLILLGLGLAWLTIVISRKIIPGKAAFLPAVLCLVIPFRGHLDASQHWFSALAVMAAMILLMEEITALRLVGAGALCGVATCFSQSRGLPAEIGLALFLLWEISTKRLDWENFRRAQAYLWGSFLSIVVLFNVYFLGSAGPVTFLRDTVAIGLRHWPSHAWNNYRIYMIDWPRFHPWYRLPTLALWGSIYLLLPLIYILFFVRYWDEEEDRASEPWDRLMLLTLTGLMIFLGVAWEPSWLRLCAVAPPAVILFVWFVNSPGRFHKYRTGAVWALAIILAIGECGEREFRWRAYVTLPIGRVALLDHTQDEEVQYLKDQTKPGDYLFGGADLDYLLDLQDPARVPYVTSSDYTRPEQVSEVIKALEAHSVKFVFWPIELDLPPRNPSSANHLAPLYDYLSAHYRVVKTFPGYDALLERVERPVPQPVVQQAPPAPTPPPASDRAPTTPP